MQDGHAIALSLGQKGACLHEISYYRQPGWNDVFVCKLCFQTRLSQTAALSYTFMISVEKNRLVMSPIQATHKKASQFLYYYFIIFKLVLTILNPRFAYIMIASAELETFCLKSTCMELIRQETIRTSWVLCSWQKPKRMSSKCNQQRAYIVPPGLLNTVFHKSQTKRIYYCCHSKTDLSVFGCAEEI